MKEALESLYNLVSEFVYEAQHDMPLYRDKDFRLSMPAFLIDLLLQSCHSTGYAPPTVSKNDFYFMGVKVIESNALEFAIFHIDYPMYQEKDMCRRFPLNPIYAEKGSNYEKRILKIQSIMPKGTRENSQFN